MTEHAPQRIQLKRSKGWRKPEGAVVVSRPSKWGNPFVIHEHVERCGDELERCPLKEDEFPVASAAEAVSRFRHMLLFPISLDPRYVDLDEIRFGLAGRDLACWCPIDAPCHADVLLELANAPEAP